MMPSFGNLAVQNLKDTSLVSLISISDLTFRAQSLRNITLDSVTIYSLTLIGYFVMALALTACHALAGAQPSTRPGLPSQRARMRAAA